MKLSEKGPIQPVPKLAGAAEAVSQTIRTWPGIIAATHWLFDNPTLVDGADFYVGEAELGHIHLDGEVHLALNHTLRQALVKRRLAKPFPWGRDWVVAPIRNTADAEHAVWLFRLGYDRIAGLASQALERRIADYDRGGKSGPSISYRQAG